MCGRPILHTDTDNYNISVDQIGEANIMPPSITLGTDHVKPTSAVIKEDSVHLLHEGGDVTNREIPTIDLAASDDAELQKAIVLSLQDQPAENPSLAGILSAEERDVSKVIEDSMFDAPAQSTVEILNPIDRRRIDMTPVGLKNIGNSCWFNVVIQPLFYIPFFREMILRYDECMESSLDVGLSKVENKRLVPTLRRLFSLLIASEKKYVDPSEAVDLFQGNEMRKNTQQDVCEFIHKLLEKLEDDFHFLMKNQGQEKEALENNMKESDFMKLFYGQAKKEVEEENGDPKLEIFGQYPLTVKTYRDIHESILASMTNETSLQENIQQETWFKTLPSILIFSLSRYEFSKEKQRAEKVHNKFDFPQYLFMDRYMESNKEVIKEKHFRISKIKKELKSLYNSLENFQRYGSGECKYPLVDILKYALEFAESQSPRKVYDETTNSPVTMEIDINECGIDDDVEMKDTDEEHKCSSLEKCFKTDLNERSRPMLVGETQDTSPNKKMRLLSPAPQTLNPGELSVLQTCLPRWQHEVEIQVHTLKCSIYNLEKKLDEIFEEPELNHIRYKLHAVVVHEGQASGGHYWVYIHDSFKDVWMKFNDIQVVVSNWQELLQESVGGQNNASAYCLMYIDETKHEMLFASYKASTDDIVKELPIDLQEYLKQDNFAFIKEQQEWQTKQTQPVTINETDIQAVPATAPNSPDILCLVDEDFTMLIDIHTMLSQHISFSLQKEEEYLKYENKSKKLWLNRIVEVNLEHIRNLSKTNQDNFGESMILDLGIYLLKNQQGEDLFNWHGYEMLYNISHNPGTSFTIHCGPEIVRQEASELLRQCKEKYSPSAEIIYQEWKKSYLNLINCVWNFVNGHRKLQSKYYEPALLHFIHALKMSKQLQESCPAGPAKTLNEKILLLCFRKCLVLLNQRFIEEVTNSDDENKALEIVEKVTSIILPALYFVNKSDLKEDMDACACVINEWCLLPDKLPSQKNNLIKQIVEILTSDSSEPNGTGMFFNTCGKTPNVLLLYTAYKDVAKQFINSETNTS